MIFPRWLKVAWVVVALCWVLVAAAWIARLT